MEVDYAMAFIAFLFFASLSVAYYVSINPLWPTAGTVAAADRTNDGVLGYLLADVHEVPVRFNSDGAASDKPLYFNFTWPFGQNSTRVYAGALQLPCKIAGDAVHWQSDLHDGWNDFRVKFANKTEAMNCTGAFDTANENQTIPWAQEKKTMLLQSRIDSMLAMGYVAFKAAVGADRDFRVEINASGSVTGFGASLPTRSDIHRRVALTYIFENATAAEVSVLVW